MTCADRAQTIHANFVADVKPTFSTALAESGPSFAPNFAHPTSAFGKSGHSRTEGEISSGEWLLYLETSRSGARIWRILSGRF